MIVLDNGETRFLMLGMDVGDSLNGEQKQMIEETYGFDYEHILNFNTHNHSAPHWGHNPAPRGKPVILWSSGAAGDQNLLFSSEGFPRTYEADGYSESIDTPDGTQYMIQRHWRFQHGIDVIKVINAITDMKDKMRISTSSEIVEFLGQKAPEGADMQYNRLLVDNFLRGYRPELFENGRCPEKKLVEMIPEGTVELRMLLAVLGDTALVGQATEPYCKVGFKCKEASPLKNTVIVTHTDSRKAGYILDDDSADHKVFQSYASVHPRGNDAKIVRGMLRMFDDALNK